MKQWRYQHLLAALTKWNIAVLVASWHHCCYRIHLVYTYSHCQFLVMVDLVNSKVLIHWPKQRDGWYWHAVCQVALSCWRITVHNRPLKQHLGGHQFWLGLAPLSIKHFNWSALCITNNEAFKNKESLCMPHPSHPLLFHYPNNGWQRVLMMMLLIV